MAQSTLQSTERHEILEKATPADEDEDLCAQSGSDSDIAIEKYRQAFGAEESAALDDDLVLLAAKERVGQSLDDAGLANSSLKARFVDDRDRIYQATSHDQSLSSEDESSLSESEAEEVEVFKAKQKKKRR
jgi:hypothetical protein